MPHQANPATTQELALIADRVNDAVLICDASRCIRWANPAFTRLTGFTLSECLGQLPEELLSGPHTEAAVIAQMNQQLARGASVEQLEICLHRKDGEPFWVGRSVQPIQGPEGHIQRYIEVFADASAARRSADERARRLSAEVALAAKMEFLSRMGHSMRSPLNAVLGFSGLLAADLSSGLGEVQQRHLQHIQTAGQQLLSLLDQALEFAQLDDKAVAIRPQRLELAVMLREVRAALEDQAKALKTTVVVECPSLTVWADATQTRAILTQLALNAIQYSPYGSTVWLTGKADHEGRLGLIEVRDQGFGIAPSDLPNLFQPFTRLDSSSRSTSHGNGLGLAVSQRFAELMHGNIDVSSTLGHGSRFTLSLPLAALPELGGGGDAFGQGAGGAVALPPLRVVHIEDNALNRSLVEAVFAAYPQVRLFSAENAADGMDAIESIQPDVALVDINLPDGSGLDLCRRLRAQAAFAHLPLIALSADALPDHIARALQTGFNHYLVKPLQIPRLLNTLATLPSVQAQASTLTPTPAQ